jgi:ribosome-binding factor A
LFAATRTSLEKHSCSRKKNEDADARQQGSGITSANLAKIMSRHRHHDQSVGASQRQLRVGELIRHELAEMLTRGEIHDPVIETHMITVPEVRMTADLRLATIYIIPLGGRDEKQVLDALERNKRYMRGEIARRVNLKFAPEIRFRIDDRFAEAERIEKLLRTPVVRRDLAREKDQS